MDIVEGRYLTRVRLKGVRGFRNLDLNLQDEDGPRMLSVVIGRNGTCKSTLLRAIAIGLCHESDANALLAKSFGSLIGQGRKNATIELEFVDCTQSGLTNEAKTVITRDGDREIVEERTAGGLPGEVFVCAYGAARGSIGTSSLRTYRTMDSVSTLFDYQRDLTDPELMLRRLQDFLDSDRYEATMSGLRRVLDLSEDHHIGFGKGGGVFVSGPGIDGKVQLEAWADGYRMTLTWIIDLFGWAMNANAFANDGLVRGLLLIDEVEQHLHPSMQSSLLPDLSQALPGLQVVSSTHSPLTALGVGTKNVVALHRRDTEVVSVPVPDLTGYSAEDVLVEEALFGTNAYAEETRSTIERHREIAAIPKDRRTKKQTEELKKLSKKLDPSSLPSQRDDLIADKLDKIAELLEKGGTS